MLRSSWCISISVHQEWREALGKVVVAVAATMEVADAGMAVAGPEKPAVVAEEAGAEAEANAALDVGV